MWDWRPRELSWDLGGEEGRAVVGQARAGAGFLLGEQEPSSGE